MSENKKKASKPYFTRKNLIACAIAGIFAVVYIFCGFCLTATENSAISAKNPIVGIAEALKLEKVVVEGVGGIVSICLIGVYLILLVIAIIYIHRYGVLNGIKWHNWKLILADFIALAVCVGMSYGIAVIIQLAQDNKAIDKLSLLIGETFLITLIVGSALALLVISISMLWVNFSKVDKPFRFFKRSDYDLLEDDIPAEDDSLLDSFDDAPGAEGGAGNGNGAGGAGGASGNGTALNEVEDISKARELDEREKVFPGLSKIDEAYDGYVVDHIETDDVTLEELSTGFRKWLAKNEKLWFDIDTIRFFLSGFAATPFSILEGLSGTGKSSLPRYFAKYVGGEVVFLPVQTTWRDKSSILGYFNDFARIYNESDCLLKLYEANYNADKIYMFVLDEMNISRVEYYFADFLSVLEYPESEWKIRVMQLPYGFVPPAKLEDGFVQITTNCYFVGTANKDDSTFSIADKVYNRASSIYFENRNASFEVEEEEVPSIKLSASKLHSLYEEALNNKEFALSEDDLARFTRISDYIYEKFDVTFGNRILNQIEIIVPTFVASGGRKEDALDFLLSRKLISKLEGRFEEYVKPALKKLLELMDATYGEKDFARSKHVINTLIKRL